MVDYYFDTVMDVAPEGDYVMPTDTVFSPREVDAHMYEGDNLTPTSLGSWRKALLSQASQMAGLTTTPEITALLYSSSRTKNSCT